MEPSDIDLYLERPPYYGRSHARDNAIVKPLCGPTGRFDGECKMWTTRCEDALRALIASDKWHPVGIDSVDYAPLMRAAEKRRANAEARWKAEQEARKVREEEERKKQVVEEAIKMSRKKAREAAAAVAEIKAKRQKREEEAKAAAAAPVAAAKPPAEKKRDGLEPTMAEVAECKRLGFTEQAIAYSNTLIQLGPRGSLSNEGRVLRWCLLDLAPDEGVRELTHEERLHSWGGREVRWTLPEDASRKFAAKLHEDAMKAMAENDAAAGV
jgi:hypothetical protein